jgi:hypothetical protein
VGDAGALAVATGPLLLLAQLTHLDLSGNNIGDEVLCLLALLVKKYEY